MKKLSMILLGLSLHTLSHATACTPERGSCFKVQNNHTKSIRLTCFEHADQLLFHIIARKNSVDSILLDKDKSSPTNGIINCYLTLNGQNDLKRFNFENPYVNSAITVDLNAEGNHVDVRAETKDGGLTEYQFDL